jgi:hypothetical protein
LTIEDTLLGYELSDIPGYLKKIAAIRIIVSSQGELPTLQEVYLAKEGSYPRDLSMTIHQLPLLENAEIIDAHYGYLEQGNKDMHLYVLPLKVRQVRPRVMDSRRNPIAADPLELAHPLAIQLEEALLSQALEKGLDILVIHHALEVIQQYHAGVHRHSGEPFFTHPIAVALIVLAYSKDQDTVVAALLHDTVEDTRLTLAHVKVMFGERVGFIVDKVTNLDSKLRKIKLWSQEMLVRLLHAEDEAVALVKLADRLHNTRTIISHTSLEKKKRIVQESLGFSVPFARLFKLDAIAQELEKRSLAILEK